MTHIKRVVMHGFKSFARKTEIPLENAMNVIVGPNGSGKSNITDALCFVLGRLSIKSIRAAKAANLLFSGNQTYKGAQEAYVEMVFDNTDKTFSLDEKEISIKRVVRKNGQSIYKINDQTKTRQELLELLGQAGIDPNGFNIVLQGEIQSLVKASAEERRKIIEEVAGISVYETRKHKSLKELEKTEEKLKEVGAVLKERSRFLKNLERDRHDALTHKKLEENVKRCKGTLLSKAIAEKQKDIDKVVKGMKDSTSEIAKIKENIGKRDVEGEQLQSQIEKISKSIQSSGEQEDLYNEISNLKAELAGLVVRKENFDNRIVSGRDKILDMKEKKESLEEEISGMQNASPKIKKQQEQHQVLQKKLDDLESKRRRFYQLKSELSTLEHQKQEKDKFLIESKKEVQLIERNIQSLFEEIKSEKSLEKVRALKTQTASQIKKHESDIESLEQSVLNHEKLNAIYESDIKREEKNKHDIHSLEFCSVCKQEVGEDHKHHIADDANEKISFAKKKLDESSEIREKNGGKILALKEELATLRKTINELDIDEVKILNAEERKEQLVKITKAQKEANEEVTQLNDKLHKLRASVDKLKNVEEDYDEARVSLQELSFADLDVDAEISLKRRELNRFDVEIKSNTRDVEESQIELKKIVTLVEEKEKILERKSEEERVLYEKNKKFHEEKTALQDKLKAVETDIIGLQHSIRNVEERINHNKIQKAEHEARLEALKGEISEFGDFEPVKDTVEKIKERLQNAQFRLSRLGTVNLKALDMFDTVKEQVEKIEEKVLTIEGEKEKIAKIIQEIDKKKKKAFLNTLNAVNEYFTRNFSQLSKKGNVFLELENKKEPFEGGLNILVKVSRGKYFDIQSLSGGERTMVALSLIFAIQEYRPYCFYVFDEIDAALDKRNSELLAALIKKYMTTGQYIIITHNDTLISEATNLYGVSMQENISKVISLKV